MLARVWGCRGSLAAPGEDTVRYGGNTSCVEVRLASGHVLVLDAGTGMRPLGAALAGTAAPEVHILLTHLHLDHLQGLGFFQPLFQPGTDVHLWGPPSPVQTLAERIAIYLSPPLFPVRLSDVAANVTFHDAPEGGATIGSAVIRAGPVTHQGPTVGYRIEEGARSLAYLPDHEPAIGGTVAAQPEHWLSGYDVVRDVDVLFHDAQYLDEEYPAHVGWGHSAIGDALEFARRARVGRLVLFHHDPYHTDTDLEAMLDEARQTIDMPNGWVSLAYEGMSVELDERGASVFASERGDELMAPEASTLETDYLVVGAGALGMAFVDALIEHSDADVVMVERRHRPGGHWLDAYPFVQLHQPSRYYGVDSTPLGQDRLEPEGADVDFVERASGAEICGYFDEIMRHRFLASGRVRFFPMCDFLGDHRFRSRVTDQVTDVTVRGRVVDATYMASRVPATDPAPFAVADGVRCVPVGELTTLEHPSAGYVIVGGGKTALDAIGWLLDRGTDPDVITWLRPRDSWVLNRSYFQPGRARTFEGIVLQLEAMVASASVAEVYERLEAHGVVVRTDPTVTPTMMKGATVSLRELEQLRRVEHVVRLGHVERVEADRIVLEQGMIPTTPGQLHVHCAAAGLSDNPPRTIFTDDTITLQLVTRIGATLSGALQGFLEATGRTTDEKNRLCPPTVMPHTPFDYLRAVSAGIRTELGWQDAPDLQAWLDGSRLNLMAGLGEHDDPPVVGELQARFFAVLFPALDQLPVFAAQATPRERARMFVPAQ